MKSDFGKYKNRGPYHWDALSKNIFKHHLFTSTRYKAVLEAAEIQNGQCVCDYGCGDGALTYLCYQNNRNGQVIGVEPEPAGRSLALEALRKRNAKVAILDSSEAVLGGSQDVVICAEVIEHVSEPAVLLKELARILKRGARCIISTPVRMSETPYDREHVYEYFPGEFRELLSPYFVVQKQDYCCSSFAAELGDLRFSFLAGRPIFKYVMNAVNLWANVNLMNRLNPLGRYWLTQTVTCTKT